MPKKTIKYKLIDHTADFGIHVFGADPEELFVNAAHALFDLITDIQRLDGSCRQNVSISGADLPDLMVNWLRELLFFWSGKNRLVKRVELTALSDKKLTAAVCYDTYKPQRHPINIEIKAVTYHQIQVNPIASGWEARIIFDV